MPENGRDPGLKKMGKHLALAQVGLEMVVPVAVGLVVDRYLSCSPWGITIGTLLGFFGGLAHLIALLKRFENNGSS